MNKRDFLKNMALAAAALPFTALGLEKNKSQKRFSPNASASEEDFWLEIRNQYRLKTDYINLENGYYAIMPQETLNAYTAHIQEMNLQGSYYMRTKLTEDKLACRKTLATFLNCPLEEVIITRNTTESMDTVISGMDWKAGDEAIMAEQDYGAMLDMFKQQAKRYGIKNTILSVPNHPKSDEEIVALYENAITAKTRLIMICHIINITGQILPVKKICQMAHRHGVKVLVDGAHAIAHIDFKITELECDYYASSLHKWLSVPLGAGLLYIKKENISGLWPLLADSNYAEDDIRKLNHSGTHPMPTELSIQDAITFHQKIGSRRKTERLQYLQQYWTSQVRDIKGITINTPADASRSCAIANIGIDKMKPGEMAKQLLETYKIWTVAIDQPSVKGCRITPNIFTTTAELDTFVKALKNIAS